ncbi:MAG TPA: WD40 repeat domain-containing protein [Candidatus Babeliales bacterium]|nr:WD40 repeat domain-containing protein [Candidatus Babeliales bacterium]
MKISSFNYSIVSLLLSLSYSMYSMESENDGGYKKIWTIQIPRAVTVATSDDHIAIGTALGPVKLYDYQGSLKENISSRADGGLLFYTSENQEKNFAYVSTVGKVRVQSFDSRNERSFTINQPTYCIAQDKDKLLFGTNDNAIQVWDASSHCIQSYTSEHIAPVTALQITDNFIIAGSYSGKCIAIDKETKKEICHWYRYNVPVTALAKNTQNSCYAGYRDGHIIVADDQDRNGHPIMLGQINPPHALFSLALLKSTYLAAAHPGCVGIYDIRRLCLPVIAYQLQNQKQYVAVVEATEKGFVSLASDGTVELWEEAQ